MTETPPVINCGDEIMGLLTDVRFMQFITMLQIENYREALLLCEKSKV
jgi:hypothetical protein